VLLVTIAAIVVLIAWLSVRTWPKQKPRFQNSAWSADGCSADTIRSFFRDPSNFANAHIDEVVSRIGPWKIYDDWDWGRLVYEWRGVDLRVRAVTQSGYIACVEFLDPRDESREGDVVETVWQPPVRDEN
jgi:hypothetical protein